jgi:hypothetical protein
MKKKYSVYLISLLVLAASASQIFHVYLHPKGLGNGRHLDPALRPYCKPAIYLYPQQKTAVTVKIAPQSRESYTALIEKLKLPRDGTEPCSPETVSH